VIRFVLPAVAALALAGCGAGGGGHAASSTANAQDTAVKFAQCMRQHGVDVEDPQPGQSGIRIKAGKGIGDAQISAAMQACRKYSPKGNLNPNDPKVRDNMLKTAQCLRRHGVNIADPQPGQGLRIKVRQGDTKTQQAMEACRREVPPPSGAASARPNGG
jgi:hypothetical protein